jgi:hypothetical protein
VANADCKEVWDKCRETNLDHYLLHIGITYFTLVLTDFCAYLQKLFDSFNFAVYANLSYLWQLILRLSYLMFKCRKTVFWLCEMIILKNSFLVAFTFSYQ